MTDGYYISKNDEEQGPFTLEEVLKMGIELDTMVLSPQAEDWERASDLPEFFHYFEEKGIYFPTEDNLAGFWWRLLAYIADSLIVSYPISFFQPVNFAEAYKRALTSMATADDIAVVVKFSLISFFLTAVYHAICEFSPLQGSFGKKLFSLVVVDTEGRRLSFGRALLRNLGKFVSGAVLGIGYLTVLGDDRKQAWHDKWAKTFVLIRNR